MNADGNLTLNREAAKRRLRQFTSPDSVQELSEATGAHPTTARAWKLGERLPSTPYLTRLCDFIRIPEGVILFGEKGFRK